MTIVKARKEHSKKISELMLSELEIHGLRFPDKLIKGLREHAKEENILREFEDGNLIAFVAITSRKLVGFIVGYEDLSKDCAMIHYITSTSIKIKEELLERFIKECKYRDISKIITDTFEFMSNKEFFESNRFVLVKKERLAVDLEMLWYEFRLT